MAATQLERFPVNALNWKSVSGLVVFAFALMVFIMLTVGQDQRALAFAIAVLLFAFIASLLATANIGIIRGRLVAGSGFYKVKVPLRMI